MLILLQRIGDSVKCYIKWSQNSSCIGVDIGQRDKKSFFCAIFVEHVSHLDLFNLPLWFFMNICGDLTVENPKNLWSHVTQKVFRNFWIWVLYCVLISTPLFCEREEMATDFPEQAVRIKAKVESPVQSVLCFYSFPILLTPLEFLLFLLRYSWFTKFQVYSKVIQLYTY